MNQRSLGGHGTLVSALGLGCIGMTGFYGEKSEDEGIRTLQRALQLGCTFWDSSDAYGPHTNERLLSRVLAQQRDEVFIGTKFGVTIDPQTLQRSVNGRPDYVRRSCEASLQRLGVEHIDLYYQHRVDPATPIEETVGAMADLVREGKVRYLGLCEAAPETIRRAHGVHPIIAVQTEYSLWSRDVEEAVLPTLRELGIGLVAYAPLGHGFPSGHIRTRQDLAEKDVRRSQPRFAEVNLEHNGRAVDQLKELAVERNTTTAQLALSWLLHQGEDIIPIPGTTDITHLEENIAAAEVRLSTEELARIAELVPVPRGERYDPGGMRSVGI